MQRPPLSKEKAKKWVSYWLGGISAEKKHVIFGQCLSMNKQYPTI